MNKNLNYIELVCEILPNQSKHIDMLIARLSEMGYESFMETDYGINAYIPENDFKIEELSSLENTFEQFRLQFSHRLIADQNWNETWTENYFEPIVFGNTLVVRASFHTDFPRTENEIIIDPKTAFGTGYHATTYMLIEEILKNDLKGKSVLDMGTGTGILAILSKMKGSGFTYAVDNDPKSIVNTSENISVNHTKDIKLELGDINILKDEQFDLIFENIWKNIVIADLPILFRHMNNKGILLTSGFYHKEFEEVKKAGEDAGFRFTDCKERDGWAMVKFIKEI
jgi:ribosomal protein L11 methyltransferase